MRLTALWWWIDRWRKSSAYTDMTLAEQGAYRNLLDEAHLREGALPNDERILAKACGDALSWKKVRVAVMARFTLQPDGWHNETLDEVRHESQKRSEKQSRYRNGVGNASSNGGGHKRSNGAGNTTPPPVPVPVPVPISEVPSELLRRRGRGLPPLSMQLKRLKIWLWMVDEFIGKLGEHADEFNLDDWIRERDEAETRVITGDWWDYWLPAFEAEVRRRGLSVTGEKDLRVTHAPWICPHVVPCGNPGACRNATILGRPVKETHAS